MNILIRQNFGRPRGKQRKRLCGGQKYNVSEILTGENGGSVLFWSARLFWKEILQLNYLCHSLSNCHRRSALVEMYHLYVFGCQSVRQQQTGFCLLLRMPAASGEWLCL